MKDLKRECTEISEILKWNIWTFIQVFLSEKIAHKFHLGSFENAIDVLVNIYIDR